MRRNTACLFLFGSLLSLSGMTHTKKDSIQAGRNYMIDVYKRQIYSKVQQK